MSSKAINYKPQQLSFRNDIKSYLYEEGYAPTINSNTEDIYFKIEGTNYSIELDTDYDSPFLVSLNARFNVDELSKSKLQRLYAIENDINEKYSCVKCSYSAFEDYRVLSFTVESFCHSSEDFKYALARYINIMRKAIADFMELYNDEPSSSKSLVVHNPFYTTTSENKGLKILSVEVTTEKTIVNFEYTNLYSAAGWVQIEPVTHILVNGQTLWMTKAVGIPQSPKKHNFSSQYDKLSFSLYFPALPSGVTKFDLIESSNSSWKFYGITLK